MKPRDCKVSPRMIPTSRGIFRKPLYMMNNCSSPIPLSPTTMPSADSLLPTNASTAISATSLSSSPFSISLAKTKPSKAVANPRKRPRSSLADESDSDYDTNYPGTQSVSSFDRSAGGAIGFDSKKRDANTPLVITAQKNRDWRAESSRKKGRNLLPAEEIARRERQTTGELGDTGPKPQIYGLTILKKEDAEPDIDWDGGMREPTNNEVANEEPMTADEEAVAALMGAQRRKELVVPAVNSETEENGRFTGRAGGTGAYEEDAFKSDVASRPDSASLDDYAAVPIEEFGAALLRGMGWKEGDVVGKRKDRVIRPRVLERRPQLLGLGAKEVPEGLEEIGGAWGKAAKGKKMSNKGFTQMLLKNTKTGELLSEEELKAKKEQQAVIVDGWRERRDRNLAVDESRKVDRKERKSERERHGEGNRHNYSRRDRSRSWGRKGDRRRDHTDDLDSDRQDRDRERRRREMEAENDRDGERSSKHEHRGRRDYDYERSSYRSSAGRHGKRDERDEHRSRRGQEVY